MTKVPKKEIRTRMAPSPTGNLHIGTARTALFNWFFAHHHAGVFILRIEDTDIERSEKKYEEDIVEGLKWLGIEWDEFYKQSDRIKIYAKYIQKLLDSGKVFWCYHSEEELESERKKQIENKELPRHTCIHKSKGSKIEGKDGIIRLAVDENSERKIIFEDIIKGKIEFEERLLGDVSIAKNLQTPLYNLAAVIDDYEMDITHVIRGEDHIANTPKQILIAETLGFESPLFAHLPLILGPDRSKLSKRHGATSIIEYREQGYLPDAMDNFLALLGWTPAETDREILTKNEIIEQFSLEKIHKSGAVFDVKKLNWINSQYIRTYNDEQLTNLVYPFVKKFFGEQNKELVVNASTLFRERLEYLDKVKEFHYFFKKPEYEADLLIWKKGTKEQANQSLELVANRLIVNTNWNTSDLRGELDRIAKDNFSGDRGMVYWPLRVALSGERFSADPIEIMKIIDKETTLERIQKAIAKLSGQVVS